MSQELIQLAIKRYEAEKRQFRHPTLSQCFVKDNVVILRNITGLLARYAVDELMPDEPEPEEPTNNSGTE